MPLKGSFSRHSLQTRPEHGRYRAILNPSSAFPAKSDRGGVNIPAQGGIMTGSACSRQHSPQPSARERAHHVDKRRSCQPPPVLFQPAVLKRPVAPTPLSLFVFQLASLCPHWPRLQPPSGHTHTQHDYGSPRFITLPSTTLSVLAIDPPVTRRGRCTASRLAGAGRVEPLF